MSTNTTDQVYIDMTVANEDLLPGDRLLEKDGSWGDDESVVVSATDIAGDPDSVYLIMTVFEGKFTAGYRVPRTSTTNIQRAAEGRSVLMGIASRDLLPGDVLERTNEVVTAVEEVENDPEGVRVFIATDDRQPMAYIRRLTTPALIRRRIDAGHILPDLIGAAA